MQTQTQDQTQDVQFVYYCDAQSDCNWSVSFVRDMARPVNPVRLIPGGCPDCHGDVRVLIKTDNGEV